MRLAPLDDLVFDGQVQPVTCVNHPLAHYLWKGPGRSLHFICTHWVETVALPDGTVVEGMPDVAAIEAAVNSGEASGWTGECTCPASDLRLVIED